MPGQNPQHRRFAVGAELLPTERSAHFRVWAPRAARVDLLIEGSGRERPLIAEPGGYFSTTVPDIEAESLYRYRLDGGEAFPDPVSRFQPNGPHGPSALIDGTTFRWTDEGWAGLNAHGQIIYEMHIGTFTKEGTWRAALRHLKELRDLGITTLEVMPINEFPGDFNWGYDGVFLFSPAHVYGTPNDVREFVNEAHSIGLGVILDVVYNHLGPDGNYLGKYSDDYFTERYRNDWGAAINFDGEHSQPVREFFLSNAAYWISEFHFDGLRLDATQDIHDASESNILAAIGTAAREAAGRRGVYIACENEPQQCRLVRRRSEDGLALDALWNDDFHHTALVAATGKREAYYTDYLGSADEFVAAAKWAFLYQGQYYAWQKQRRGTSTFGIAPYRFIHFLENHDQVANSGHGLRLHQRTSPGVLRALTAVLLLFPQTPLLFQGQEFASSKHFVFFAHHRPELAELVHSGRAKFLSQFPSLASPEAQAGIQHPADRRTFDACKLDHREKDNPSQAAVMRLHRDLLALRRRQPCFSSEHPNIDGASLSAQAFILRYFDSQHGDRLLVVNLGAELACSPAPIPLLAALPSSPWELVWSSESTDYGGAGTPLIDLMDEIVVPGQCAMFFSSTTLE